MASDLSDLEAIQVMKRYYRWKHDLVSPHLGPRVLEVGCGTGLLLETLSGRELLLGVDRDPGCIERAAARLAARPEAEARVLDATAPAFLDLAGMAFTGVLFASSLEEVPDDLRALENARAVLVPGGRIVVLAAALPALTGNLDAIFGARRYSPERLGTAFQGAGFLIEKMRYVNLLGALGCWWDNMVLRRRSVPPGTYRVRDLAIPVARLIDAVTGPPVGRSLLAVGRKPQMPLTPLQRPAKERQASSAPSATGGFMTGNEETGGRHRPGAGG